MAELSIESLAEKLDSIHKVANVLKADVDEIKERDHPMATHKAKHADETDEDYKARVAQEDEDEKKEAQEDEEKKEARKGRYSAMKQALAEEDEEKRDAAMKKAMEPTEHTIRNDKERTAQDEEEKKEEHANVASIIGDKRQEFINKILTANKVFNASNIKEVEKRVRKASLTKLKTEWKTVEPFIAAQTTPTPTEQTQPVIPFFANIMNPEQVDASQLNASSPDSAFAQISTKELLEMAE